MQPQGLLHMESDNHLGRVLNPFSAGLSIQPCAGPMCRSLRDMDLFLRVILAQKPYLKDPLLVPIPWTGPNTGVVKLKIGIMATDGMITPAPPILRAISWAQKRLEHCADVEVKSFAPYQAREVLSLVRRIFMPDGGVGFKNILAASVIDVATDSSHVSDIALLRSERDEYRRTMAKHWNEQDVDIVLMPVFVGPAPAHDTAIYKSYTSVWNLVDHPAVSIPTPLYAGATGSEVYADSHVLGEEDAFVRRAWEETSFEGAPLSLQLVARKHHDNLLFGALQLLKQPLQLV
ncbi:hypothetical protein AUEXF2481DRAFT_31519 [Aureobasidium subglaciale EXF-2481]|uniref:Amidase domain-containing protein n=1 Tax=Aureobasidium subglaciale (strain EXF-2481) TaxID=1043005 RepID=A0A074Y5J9_AURSE|nr:uncharacterized protein AUEXF2481DRAFT_31519 [Aureobasidium subglaciale EXF-2481]KEQ93063.1 hypothetical protein AUEXF2481DRAFT_31519 [Aureobasidium subglaciale EXF-2481]